eukprot:CAMPEP_0117443422 /NCGR_PEP_ID=MMETSP0759-20121206/4686_1 /TAXON_ID=63605 /ORGANISM="Percolomonas cosmopolitus, Strain WS" /LENGTH=366 /DNA_ID=CAMNT_0005235395 /DNA_START=229 /DNA_END=1329 /DNA_ORIENTATION=+
MSLGLSNAVYELNIPQKLRHGTIDELLTLSDNLQKYDVLCESTESRVLRFLVEMKSFNVQNKGDDEWIPEVIVSEDRVDPVHAYLTAFQWDEGQYMLNKPVQELAETIHKKIARYEEEFRQKSQKFITLNHNIDNLQRKAEGSLVVKPLDGIIGEENIVETEYLSTIFVVVPKSLSSEWKKHYDEDMLDEPFVVPDSSVEIAKDSEYILYSAIVMRKFKDDFELACQKRKFIVRKFEYDPERANLAKMEASALLKDRDETRRDVFEWCKMCFSECFSAWIHIKAMRTYVESVLRYGVPPQFVSLLIKVNPRKQKKLHRFFKDNYKHLQDEDFGAMDSNDASNPYGMEFHPYVLLTINTDDQPLLKL